MQFNQTNHNAGDVINNGDRHARFVAGLRMFMKRWLETQRDEERKSNRDAGTTEHRIGGMRAAVDAVSGFLGPVTKEEEQFLSDA